MKRIILLSGVLLFLVPTESSGYSLRTLEGIGIGPRALGMGGAFVALADDASSVYWNPAGLAFVEHPTFYGEISARQRISISSGIGFAPDFPDFTDPLRDFWGPSGRVSMDLISLVYPFQGANIAISHLRPFEAYTERYNGTLSDLVVRRTSITFSGKSGETFAMGFNIDYNQMKIDYSSSFFSERFRGDGYSMEIGALVKPDTVFSFGLMISLGLKVSGTERIERDEYWLDPPVYRVEERTATHKIPTLFRLGFGLKPHKRVNIALGFNFVNELKYPVCIDFCTYPPEIVLPLTQAGVEYWITRSLPIRLGAFRIRDETALTFGSGFRKGPIVSDIAFIRFPSEERQETRGIFSLSYVFQK